MTDDVLQNELRAKAITDFNLPMVVLPRLSFSPEEDARLEAVGEASGIADSDLLIAFIENGMSQLDADAARHLNNRIRGIMADYAQKTGRSTAEYVQTVRDFRAGKLKPNHS